MDEFEADRALVHQWSLDEAAARALELERTDFRQLGEAFLRAAAQGALAPILAGGAVLLRRGVLRGKAAHRYVEALLAAGRYAEALPLLREMDPSHPWVLNGLASALAAGGAFTEALQAARQTAETSLKRRPNMDRRDAALRTLCKIGPRLQGGGPGDWKRYLEACLEVDARAAAASRCALLADCPASWEDEDPALCAAAVQAAVRSGAATVVAPLIRRLRERRPGDEALAAAEAALALGQGRPAAALKALHGLPNPPAGAAARQLAAFAQLGVGREREAIDGLAKLSAESSKNHAVLRPLARAIGTDVLACSDLRCREARGRPQVINLLPFSNELALLKLRLEEMGPWVDRFVIVEAGQTFAGADKPLHFEAARQELAEHLDKIIHVRIEAFPKWLSAPWARDFYQRDMAVSALGGVLAPDDIVLVTDADEIIRREALDGFSGAAMGLVTSNHRYFLNYTAFIGDHPAPRRSSAICRGWLLQRFGVSYLRFYLAWAFPRWNQIPGAGWHFTSVNSATRIAAKFRSTAHAEAAKLGLGDEAVIAGQLAQIRAGVFDPGWRRQALDDSFPDYILRNREALADLIL